MKAPNDVPDEALLKELFDESIEPPSGPALTKLAARAQEIPELAKRRWWMPHWVWAPTAAGVGAVALAVFWPGAPTADKMAAPSATSAGVEVARAAPAESDESERLVPADLYVEVPGDVPPPLSAMADLDTDWNPEAEDVGLDALHGPPADADLDAWLFATTALLEEGG